MVNCQNCGQQVAEGVQFCPNCGAVVTANVESSLGGMAPAPADEVSVGGVPVNSETTAAVPSDNEVVTASADSQVVEQPQMPVSPSSAMQDLSSAPVTGGSGVAETVEGVAATAAPVSELGKTERTMKKNMSKWWMVAGGLAALLVIVAVGWWLVGRQTPQLPLLTQGEPVAMIDDLYRVEADGWFFEVPTDLEVGLSKADELYVGELNIEGWVATIYITDGNYYEARSNREKMLTAYRQAGHVVNEVKIEKTADMEYVAFPQSLDDGRVKLVAFAPVDEKHIAVAEVVRADGQLDYALLGAIAPVIMSASTDGQANVRASYAQLPPELQSTVGEIAPNVVIAVKQNTNSSGSSQILVDID